ncbi:MAG: DUF4255 domain-containing protein [Chloroflexi bacterium]|nr:DUF4255 domain-containing protein [Chloroflexota bacterium]
MSNHLAIATVTAGLGQMILPALRRAVGETTVTTRRPDASQNNNTNPRANLYLYQVIPNAMWRNADLPARRADGTLVQRPQTALDLHYLLTFHGEENQLVPQRLLAAAVGVLHSHPVLTRSAIQSLLQNAQEEDDTYHFLVGSDLANQVDSVRFSPLGLNLEELSKLWSVFFQTAYVLSVAYQASVVLVEPEEEAPQPALPVRSYNVYAMPFRQPVIERVTAEGVAGAAGLIQANSRLLVQGRRLRGEDTRLSIAGAELTPCDEDITDAQIATSLLTLPAGSLRAGVRGIQVLHPVPMGVPAVPHRGVESAVAAFVLRPSIAGLSYAAPHLTVLVNPVGATGQRNILLLNELNPPPDRRPRAYSFNATSTAGDAMFFTPAQDDQGHEDPALGELGLANPAQTWGALSADIAAFAGLANNPAQLLATLGGEGPHPVTVAGAPATVHAARAALEVGLRAAQSSPAFAAARVLRVGDRLLVLPGSDQGATAFTAAFAAAGNDPAVRELGLASAAPAWGMLSADLAAFAKLTHNPAALRVSIGSAGPYQVAVAGAPASLDAARAALESGLTAAHDTPPFTQAHAVRLSNRLLVLPGPGVHFTLTGVQPSEYLARIQMDGAESPLETDDSGHFVGPKLTVT